MCSLYVIMFCIFDSTAAGKHFVPLHKLLHFEAREIEKTVEVAIIDNNVEESDRSFNVTLLKETGQASVALAETGYEVQLTILDNDGEWSWKMVCVGTWQACICS